MRQNLTLILIVSLAIFGCTSNTPPTILETENWLFELQIDKKNQGRFQLQVK